MPEVNGSPDRRVKIVDVARAAGVRPSTVSKVLNDGRGSADVRRRVEDAVARLGYRPNQQARGLRRSESRAIGVFIPDLANPVFLPFLRGAERVAQERGYVVLIADGQRSPRAAAAALERFFDQGVDGLVLGGPVGPASLVPYLDNGVPIAPVIGDYDRSLARHWEQGEAAATREMATRLLALGHRSFTFVTTPQQRGVQGRRFREGRLGALDTELRAAGAVLAVEVVDPRHGVDAALAQLRPVATGTSTALVCASHLLAPWLLIALDEGHVGIPRDVSVVVFGDSDWARAYRPSLSVVRRDTEAEGSALATWVLDTLAGDAGPAPTGIDARYVERRSCAKARR